MRGAPPSDPALYAQMVKEGTMKNTSAHRREPPKGSGWVYLTGLFAIFVALAASLLFGNGELADSLRLVDPNLAG